jgi:hypothetical protein
MSTSSKRPSQSTVLQRSERLQDPKLVSVLDQHIPSTQKILNAADGMMAIITLYAPPLPSREEHSYHGAAVQTDQSLYFFRESGIFGESRSLSG